MAERKLKVNRAPVLTLWAAVVAERLGHDEDAALTLGKALAGLNAQSKGRRLGIYRASGESAAPEGAGRARPKAPSSVPLLGREIPVRRGREGLRAISADEPVDPESVRRYLEKKFGEGLEDTRAEMRALAAAFSPEDLAARAFALYEAFRPAIPAGARGWGAAGELDLSKIRSLRR